MKIALSLLFLLSSTAVYAIPVYGTPVGSSSFTAATTLLGFGTWAGNVSIGWEITPLAGGLYEYEYTFLHGGRDLSHLVLELTSGCGSDPNCLTQAKGGEIDIRYYVSGAVPNSFMPASIYGVKFDTSSGASPNVFSFVSDRAPVWGNVYTQDGVSDGGTYAYNPGLVALNSASYLDFVARPDGGAAVPEPSTMLMLGAALIAIGAGRRWLPRRE